MTKVLTDKLRTNIQRACDRPARCTLQVAAVVAPQTLLCGEAWKMHFLEPPTRLLICSDLLRGLESLPALEVPVHIAPDWERSQRSP